MPWAQRCLVREIRVTNQGSRMDPVTLRWQFTPIQTQAFPVEVKEEGGLTVARSPGGVVVLSELPALGRLAPGEERLVRLVLAYGPTEEDAREALACAAEPAGSLDEAHRFWHDWISQATAPGSTSAWRPHYYRSLITLKLLTYEPTGALVAAPTASFPAVPGGGDNWDYRYMWLRDGYYTAMTLDAAGLHSEARRFYDFAFSVQGDDGHWHQPLYTVDGADPIEFVIDDLAGPGGEKPVRFGNAASAQLQLDNEGNILHGLWFHYRTSGDRTAIETHWDRVRRACEWTAQNWERMESGIWEIREYVAHWVHGKVMCYVALKAGSLMAESLGHEEEAERWHSTAEQVRRHVIEGGWSPEREAYLAHYGSDVPAHVDISVLALVQYELLPVDDPRVTATVRLLEQPTEAGGLVLHGGVSRYDWAAVPFYLPTVWMARYYLMAGRLADCDRLLQTCLDCATDLGLMAEHFDGRDLSQWGNFPQAFSHEEVARLVLERGLGHAFPLW